jgi:hypothetical protein
MSALRFIKQAEIPSGVSSYTLSDMFSNDYKVYKVTMDNLTTAAAAILQFRFQEKQSQFIRADAYYYRGIHQVRESGAFADYQGNAINQFGYESLDVAPKGSRIVMYVFNPMDGDETSVLYESMATTTTVLRGNKGHGYYLNYFKMGGMNLFLNTSTFTGGTITVYGLKGEL